MIYFKCSRCGNMLDAPASLIGQTLQCPKCNGDESVPEKPIYFKCSKCGQSMGVDPNLEGKPFQCIKCGHSQVANKSSRLFPDRINVKCPICAYAFDVDPTSRDEVLRCPECGCDVAIPKYPAVLKCSNCGQNMTVAACEGEVFECCKCGHDIVLETTKFGKAAERVINILCTNLQFIAGGMPILFTVILIKDVVRLIQGHRFGGNLSWWWDHKLLFIFISWLICLVLVIVASGKKTFIKLRR